MLKLFFLFVPILISVAFFSLFERKLLSYIQSRKGPNKVGINGILQPFSDAMKLISKVESNPFSSVKSLYFFSPFLVFFLSLMFWTVYSSEFIIFSLESGMLLILVFLSMSAYGLIFSGWFSNSKYSSIGSMRSLAQSISYEIGLTSCVICFCLLISTFNIAKVVSIQLKSVNFLFLLPLFVLMFIFFLAETGRVPFDLPEGESELVSGYSVEYGGLSYTLIFLGENLSFLWLSVFFSFLFYPSVLFVTSMVFLLVWIRSSLPRIRFDKVMLFFWVVLLPITLGVMLMYSSIWFYQNQISGNPLLPD